MVFVAELGVPSVGPDIVGDCAEHAERDACRRSGQRVELAFGGSGPITYREKLGRLALVSSPFALGRRSGTPLQDIR